MSQNPLIPAKPARITLDTLPQLFAHHRARFGGWSMTQGAPEPGQGAGQGDQGGQQQNQPPERPDDIPEETWTALGDPGKQAIVREREARQAAERALAAARAKPAPPKPPAGDQGGDQGGGQQQQQSGQGEPPKPKPGDQPDFAALIKQAVSEAVKPFQEAEDRRQTEVAAEKVRTAVLDAAKPRLHDATDALAGIDLAGVVDDQGQADAAKVKSALDDLVTRKPHLAKGQRQAPPGIGGGAPPAGATDAEKVKAVLADMQRSTGIRTSPAAGTNS